MSRLNPDARLDLYGQEINDQSYAICKSDMIAKGQDAGQHQARRHPRRRPVRRDAPSTTACPTRPTAWTGRLSEDAVKAEHDQRRLRTAGSRRGLPEHRRRPDAVPAAPRHQDAPRRRRRRPGRHRPQRLPALQRAAPSPGESEIRRWLLENDLVEAIVALPTEHVLQHRHRHLHLDPRQHQAPRARRQGPVDRRHRALHQDAQEPRLQEPRAHRRATANASCGSTTTFDDERPTPRSSTNDRLRLLDHHRRAAAAANFTCTPERIDARSAPPSRSRPSTTSDSATSLGAFGIGRVHRTAKRS